MMIPWSLRNKILLGYGALLALLLLVLYWAFIYLHALGRAGEAILKENYKSILAAQNMIETLERQDSASLLMILGYRKEALPLLRENQSRFSQWMGRAKDNITVRGERPIINKLEKDYSVYLGHLAALDSKAPANRKAQERYYHERVLPAFKTVRHECGALRELNQETMYRASDRAKRLSRNAMISMAGIGLTAIAVGVFFSVFLSHVFTRPLQALIDATRKVAAGDYAVALDGSARDEIGAAAAAFNVMTAKLREYHLMNIGQILDEKRKSEAIIREIDDGIIVMDRELRVQNINPAAAAALGLAAADAKNEHFLELVRNDALYAHIERAAETGAAPTVADTGESNILTVRRGDATFHYLFSVTPFYAEAETVQGIVLALRDVTKLKELERLKNDFVMTASHELRTPITTIGMSLELLHEEALPRLNAKERELLAAAREESGRLRALINDLLELSRIESGKIAMEFEPLDTAALFERVSIVMRAQAQEKSVRIETGLTSDLPTARADSNKITWVLINLVGNALRYTAEGGFVRLSARRIGEHLHFSVADNGMGIPPEYHTKIFDKFVRVEQTAGPQGTGLGLAICREIIHAHGGVIWVNSTPREGSVFTFTLPLNTTVRDS